MLQSDKTSSMLGKAIEEAGRGGEGGYTRLYFQLPMDPVGLGLVRSSPNTTTRDVALHNSSPALFWGCPLGPKVLCLMGRVGALGGPLTTDSVSRERCRQVQGFPWGHLSLCFMAGNQTLWGLVCSALTQLCFRNTHANVMERPRFPWVHQGPTVTVPLLSLHVLQTTKCEPLADFVWSL